MAYFLNRFWNNFQSPRNTIITTFHKFKLPFANL